MSASITIPKRRRKAPRHSIASSSSSSSSPSTGTSGSSSSSYGMGSPAESSRAGAGSSGVRSTFDPVPVSHKGKGLESTADTEVESVSGSWDEGWRVDEWGHRRPSLLGSSIRQSEHTVINIGAEDAPRLGFDWNQEIFLPSYHGRYGTANELEHKSDPIQDIILTDEEAAGLFPS